MSTQIIRPARSLQGSLTVPGDKSISHRYAMLAGLAEGTSRLTNFSTGADPHSSLACMEALGARVLRNPDGTLDITGVAGAFRQAAAPLDCGNSGSTMRMLSGLVASHPHTFTLLGDPSLTLRPMDRIRNPLSQMGAKINLTDGHAPITIHGTPLRAIDFNTPIPSSSQAYKLKASPASPNPSSHATTLSTLCSPSEPHSPAPEPATTSLRVYQFVEASASKPSIPPSQEISPPLLSSWAPRSSSQTPTSSSTRWA